RQRGSASAVELRIEQQERQSAEMIAVQMRYEDCVNAVGIDAELPHGYEARRSAVDQEGAACCLDEEAGVEPPAATEGVTTAEKLDFHRNCAPSSEGV